LENRPQKIDHPPNGSKDVADAVAGAIYNCERFEFLHRFSPATVLNITLNGSVVDGSRK